MSKTLGQMMAYLQASKTLTDPMALEIKSSTYFFLCTGVALTCLAVFQWLQQKINDAVVADGYTGLLEELTIFDVRFGYPLETVIHVLGEWGSAGRILYLMVQTVDVFVYHPAYRGASLVMLNRLMTSFVTRFPSLSFLRQAALFPIFLSTVDFYEDLGQITYTVWWEFRGELIAMSSSYWQSLVVGTSLMNQAKWWCVRGGGAATLVVLLCVVAHMMCQGVWRLMYGNVQKVEKEQKDDDNNINDVKSKTN